ncbi:MAG: helix-turn-helix transcriptional regulator [Candidatus Kariarchaeaceae archaeon]|jgi:predicted ArsR family transcriptional regulator
MNNNEQSSEDLGLLKTFSSSKREILKILKKHRELDLKSLSEKLNITKMGALKHINELEDQGFIDRTIKKEKSGKGRPKHFFRLSDESSDIFPRAYSNLTCFALEFIEEKLGSEGIESALRKRSEQVKSEYEEKLKGKQLNEKVEILTNLRDQEGYMATMSKTESGNIELLEYNCPIFDVAQKYGAACVVEKELFENLLETEIETTHRVVNNDKVCRFLIKNK